jgi:hypothetical protein
MILMALSTMFLINPSNASKTEKHQLSDGLSEEYFSKDIAVRIIYFFQLYGLLNFSIPLIGSFLLKNNPLSKTDKKCSDVLSLVSNTDSILFYSQEHFAKHQTKVTESREIELKNILCTT